jgi:hemerythrin-like domain-containing protein
MLEKNPTDILRKEHDIVLKILDGLKKNLEAGDTNQAKKSILLLEKEFNKHSLNKEEKALFPEIEKFMPREGGPTGMMIIEHKELTESIENFKQADNLKNLNEIGNHIILLLREHIGKENNMLFMMADMDLTNKQKKIILKKFEDIDIKGG